MNNIEKIRQEIERRKKVYLTKNGFPTGTFGAIKIETYEGLLAFIDSLPEEFPPYCTGFKGHPDPAGKSNLEEAAEMAARKIYPYEGGTKGLICENAIPIYKAGFIAGTEWQREQDAARRK